eukprot:9907867-Prorocentrum_lima.AAC.1
MISDAPLQREWGYCGEASVPMPSTFFPAWQPNSISGKTHAGPVSIATIRSHTHTTRTCIQTRPPSPKEKMT